MFLLSFVIPCCCPGNSTVVLRFCSYCDSSTRSFLRGVEAGNARPNLFEAVIVPGGLFSMEKAGQMKCLDLHLSLSLSLSLSRSLALSLARPGWLALGCLEGVSVARVTARLLGHRAPQSVAPLWGGCQAMVGCQQLLACLCASGCCWTMRRATHRLSRLLTPISKFPPDLLRFFCYSCHAFPQIIHPKKTFYFFLPPNQRAVLNIFFFGFRIF